PEPVEHIAARREASDETVLGAGQRRGPSGVKARGGGAARDIHELAGANDERLSKLDSTAPEDARPDHAPIGVAPADDHVGIPPREEVLSARGLRLDGVQVIDAGRADDEELSRAVLQDGDVLERVVPQPAEEGVPL